MDQILPVGKLPADLLAKLLANTPAADPRIVLGPGVGRDCAVIDFGEKLLVLKSDPITFATDQIGWYLVQVNANDLATAGATPRWLMATLLLAAGSTTPGEVEAIHQQIIDACQAIGVTLIGGHTEITYGLDRPVLMGTLLGEVTRENLVRPDGALPGDRLLLTKGVPIEATAIIARELPERLAGSLSPAEIELARQFLFNPGISVLRDAQIAARAARLHAMHDPTEGGLAGALWELAEASQCTLTLFPEAVPIPEISARICHALGIDPLAAIASGALLIAAASTDAGPVLTALHAAGIPAAEIGTVEAGPVQVWQKNGEGRVQLPRPNRDEIAHLFS